MISDVIKEFDDVLNSYSNEILKNNGSWKGSSKDHPSGFIRTEFTKMLNELKMEEMEYNEKPDHIMSKERYWYNKAVHEINTKIERMLE